MRRILITGGAGFLGSTFVHYWIKQYPQDFLVVLDAFPFSTDKGNLTDIPEQQVVLIEGDIKDKDFVYSLLAKHHLHTIVHFAADTSVEDALQDPTNCLTTNILGTNSVLSAAAAYQAKTHTYVRFHHVSSGEVYGPLPLDAPSVTEEAPYAPTTFYAASKAGSDNIVMAYAHSYNIPVTISHAVDTFGPYQNPSKLVPKVIQQILRGQEIFLYSNGYQTRSWVHVADHCQAIDLILHHGKIGEKYNIGSDTQLSNVELIRKICKGVEAAFEADPLFKQKFKHAPVTQGTTNETLIRFTHDDKGHELRYALNPHKIMIEFGFKPQYDFEKALSDTISWYLNRWLIDQP